MVVFWIKTRKNKFLLSSMSIEYIPFPFVLRLELRNDVFITWPEQEWSL
jgi:hypothetical protein